jgi:hypothetical protein
MCGRFVTRFLGDRGGQVLKGGSLAGVACVCVGS